MSPLLLGAALGATSAFVFDPQQGGRRRALVREFADAAHKDLRARADDIKARVRSLRGGPGSDDVLCARVRSKIGRYTSHRRAIEVTALDGRVVLTGDIVERELSQVVQAACAVPGVQHVDNQLQVHESAEHVLALQSGNEPSEGNWTPGVRALVGGAGAASLLYSLARGGIGALVPLAVGAAMLACAVNASPRQSD
jgi:hypothetical protein